MNSKNKDNVILVGMPGAGKSTVGVILAKLLGKSFIDSDIVIQQRTRKLLKDLIEEHGADITICENTDGDTARKTAESAADAISHWNIQQYNCCKNQ